MIIQKIKINKNDSIVIWYKSLVISNEAGDLYDTIKITSQEIAGQAFYNALGKLKKHVIHISELSEDDIGKIKVRGAEFTYAGDDQILGARIIAERNLNNSEVPLDFKTPHKIETKYKETDGPLKLMPDGCADDLRKLLKAAANYVNKIRDQHELKLNNDD